MNSRWVGACLDTKGMDFAGDEIDPGQQDDRPWACIQTRG